MPTIKSVWMGRLFVYGLKKPPAQSQRKKNLKTADSQVWLCGSMFFVFFLSVFSVCLYVSVYLCICVFVCLCVCAIVCPYFFDQAALRALMIDKRRRQSTYTHHNVGAKE